MLDIKNTGKKFKVYSTKKHVIAGYFNQIKTNTLEMGRDGGYTLTFMGNILYYMGREDPIMRFSFYDDKLWLFLSYDKKHHQLVELLKLAVRKLKVNTDRIIMCHPKSVDDGMNDLLINERIYVKD